MKPRIMAIFACLVAANSARGFGLGIFCRQSGAFGTALLAYVLGLRHAVDADHIAAIDNVVRKLMQDGKKPLSVGCFFSLGHSTVVVLVAFVVAATTTAMQNGFESFKFVGNVIGTFVSASFLLGIGLANLVILKSVWNAFRRAERGEILEAAISIYVGWRRFPHAFMPTPVSCHYAVLAHVSVRIPVWPRL